MFFVPIYLATMTGRGRGNIIKLFREYAASKAAETSLTEAEPDADRTVEDSGLGTGIGDGTNTISSRSLPSGFGRGSLTMSFENTVRFLDFNVFFFCNKDYFFF